MKINILILVILTFLLSCNPKDTEVFFINSDTILTNVNYQAIINDKNPDKKYYLQIVSNTITQQHLICKIVEFNYINNRYEADIKFDSNEYKAVFSISDENEILTVFPYIIKHITNSDSSFKEFSYYDLLENATTDSYLNIFNQSVLNYPENIGIFLVKWKFEGSNNMANQDSLLKQIAFLKQNYDKNPDIHFVLSIAYKLINDEEKCKEELNNLSKNECRLFNNEITVNIFNDIFKSGIQTDINKNHYKHNLRTIINKNPYSYFTIKRLSSPFNSEYDVENIPNIFNLLKKEKYNYCNLLIKLISILTFNCMPDSIDLANSIEKEILGIYDNKLQLYKSGKNAYFKQLPDYQIFNEIRFHKNCKIFKFQNAIDICRENIAYSNKNDNRFLLVNDYIRIANIFEKKLFLLDSALRNYIFAYDLTIKKDKVEKEIVRIYENYSDKSRNFDYWLDSIRLDLISKSGSNQEILKNSKSEIQYSNGSTISLDHPKMNTLLIFYSYSCTPCKYIFQSIKENENKILNINTQIIYISNDSMQEIELMQTKFNIKINKILNSKEILKKYKVNGFPVIICLNKEGQIINRQEGAYQDFNILELLSNFNYQKL